MEVMNGTEFEQTEVLIGQQGKTEAMGVSDDAMLMSMLSTGLYKYPLRTMLQEIMFNAWDAHRMGGIQETTPIDIYLNETSGLIVRDYGPGIPDEDIHEVFCIYGNSTKRDNAELTGGFGLGSKSPFAFTESFTVTSHNQGKKNMYLISRANDDNNGKPGRTTILSNIPTDETGLMVVVPMPDGRDRARALDYIKQILHLSGIHVNIHYEDEEVETIKATELKPGEFVFDNSETKNKIYAVYGGVSYYIEDDDGFELDRAYLKHLAGNLGTLYIAFPPNSLTPLPSREGLNLSSKSVETISAKFSAIREQMETSLGPVGDCVAQKIAQAYADSDIQPHFIAYRIHQNRNLNGNIRKWMPNSYAEELEIEILELLLKEGYSDAVSTSIRDFSCHNIGAIGALIGHTTFANKVRKELAKRFPEIIQYFRAYNKGLARMDIPRRTRYGASPIEDVIFEIHTRSKVFIPLHDALERLNEEVSFTKAGVPVMRFLVGDSWEKVSFERKGGHRYRARTKKETSVQHKMGGAKGQFGFAKSKHYNDRVWACKDGEEIENTMMMGNYIVLAKTVSALNDTNFKFKQYFSKIGINMDGYRYDMGPMDPYHHVYSTHRGMYPAIVVHERKGGYDAAKRIFEEMGFKVIEADEPEKKQRSLPLEPKAKVTPKFPILRPRFSENDWSSSVEVEEPTHYVYLTQAMIGGYSSSQHPSVGLAQWFVDTHPNTVLVNTKARIGKVEKLGAVSMAEVLVKQAEKILKNRDRLKKFAMHNYAIENSTLPYELLALPEVQKLFGLEYVRTRDAQAFEEDQRFIDRIASENWQELGTLPAQAKQLKKSIAKEADMSRVRAMCYKTGIFDEHVLRQKAVNMKPGERKVFSEKLMRLLRTI